MKALSIQQPWAHAILCLGKDVENRTWNTKFRGRFIIHAGKEYDQKGHDLLVRLGCDVPDNLPRGLVGEVDLISVYRTDDTIRKTKLSQWEFGPVCFKLARPESYTHPVPFKGRLNFFEVNE